MNNDFPLPYKELVERSMHSLRNSHKVKKSRAELVKERFGMGMTYSQELCWHFKMDPDDVAAPGEKPMPPIATIAQAS